MRRLATLALVAVLVVAGCSAPSASTDRTPAGTAGSTPGTPAAAASTTGTPAGTPAGAAAGVRPDPERDVRGWEDGRWYDESLALTASDGYNDSELSALVARAMARVERIRGIEFERGVDVTVVTRSELDVGGGGGDGGGGNGAAIRRATYRALFLVGESEDASERSNETRQATVRGYYSVRRDEIVVVSPTETPRIDELTLAHELVHAYQFRHRQFDLPPSPSADAIAAYRALIEGEANLVERQYERRCAANWTCARPRADAGNGGGGAAAGNASVHLGLYLLRYFPYAEGEEFVRRAYRRGGWDAVTALFGDPPVSTEQVIHPGNADAPVEVTVPDRSGTGWERVVASRGRESVVVGERGIAAMFMYTVYDDRPGALVAPETFLNRRANGSLDPADPIDYAINYSAGWGGDALATYRRGDETAYVWRLRWDSAAEAREFRRGYRRLLRYHGAERVATDGDATYWRLSGAFGGGYYVRRSGRTVTVVHAPSVNALDEVWAPAGRADGRADRRPRGEERRRMPRRRAGPRMPVV